MQNDSMLQNATQWWNDTTQNTTKCRIIQRRNNPTQNDQMENMTECRKLLDPELTQHKMVQRGILPKEKISLMEGPNIGSFIV